MGRPCTHGGLKKEVRWDWKGLKKEVRWDWRGLKKEVRWDWRFGGKGEVLLVGATLRLAIAHGMHRPCTHLRP